MAAANEFMHHLSTAACEWFLMFLMYVDAALAFILTKFATQCELHPPCLFCFRFDHVFGEQPDAYLTHFCNKHQSEVSCLVSCELHCKLSDVREMCDHCFMSLMKQKPGYPKPWLNKNFVRAPSSTGSCSCCKRQWKPKPRSQITLRVPKATMQPPLPLIKGRAGSRYRRKNYFKKTRDKVSGASTPCLVGNNIHVDADVDALSDSGCADPMFNSCSGSESGDSFYEIECENEGFVDNSRVIIHQVVRSNSVPILEPSLLNGTHITFPPSLSSNDSIKKDVKETSLFNQDLRSINDEEPSSSPDKQEGFESPGAHSVGETKVNSEIEKLKQQMEHDQEELRLLHKELEEERNAAAIAADEAMAMITRLQEEKSALHMEALQYLRMMDEQAEYDMEALDKANDLVTEKEKEIQDLEAELDYFRSRYDDELITGNTPVSFKENHMGNGKLDSLLPSSGSKPNNNINNNPVLNLEDEKKHVLKSLSELEQSELDKGTLEDEISNLNEWLEALESDRDFLEHASSTVQSHVGLEFIQEIAKHLHDMRRVRFDRRCQMVD